MQDWDTGCRVQNAGWGCGMQGVGSGMQVSDVGMQDWDAGCGDAGLGCRGHGAGCDTGRRTGLPGGEHRMWDAGCSTRMRGGVHDTGQGRRAGPRGAVRSTGGAAGGALPQQPPGTEPFPQSRQPEQGHRPRPHLPPGQGSASLASQPRGCPHGGEPWPPGPCRSAGPARLPCPRTGWWAWGGGRGFGGRLHILAVNRVSAAARSPEPEIIL